MHGPTPLFLARSMNQHRKKYTIDGMRTAADRLLTFISPALYRCDHVVPHYQCVIQSTACEEPNFEHVFEVESVAEQIIFFDRPIRRAAMRPFVRLGEWTHGRTGAPCGHASIS